MASTPSGKVTQANLEGSELLYTDDGSYGTVSSRVLNIYDYLGNLIQTYNMGSTVTQLYPIASDGWFKFVCTVTDNVSGSPWVATVYFVATGYYTAAYLNQYTSTGCGCQLDNSNLEVAENAYNAALRFNLAGETAASSAQTSIIAANYFVNASPVVQLS